MSEQIFISYRRSGGDIYAKSICEALKNRGFTVFYDIDSIHGGYFDNRILDAIAGCNDFLLVLPPASLDRCVNAEDWVRQEIAHALKLKKNIIPVLLPGFAFPTELPEDIAPVARYNGVRFVMEYFDAVIDAIVNRCTATPGASAAEAVRQPAATPKQTPKPAPTATKKSALAPTPFVRKESEGLAFELDGAGYRVTGMGSCKDTHIVIPRMHEGKPVVSVLQGAFSFRDVHGVTLPRGLVSIGSGAFLGTRIREITIPDSVTDIDCGAFEDCTQLSKIEVDPQNPAYCSLGGHLFTKDMKALVLYAPGRADAAYTLPEGVTRIGDRAFKKHPYIQNVTLPPSVMRIGNGAFWRCKSLRTVTLAEGLTNIADMAFEYCEQLRFPVFPHSLRGIGNAAFRNCKGSDFSRIGLSAGITVIGEEAFKGCTSVQDICYGGSKKEWKSIRIDDNAFKGIPARVIHCTDGDLRRWFF